MDRKIILFICFLLTASPSFSQEPAMDFEKYNPRSTLVVPEHILTRAKYPFIDVHSHHREMGSMDLLELIEPMDSMNMAIMVNLSGGSGRVLEKMIGNVRDNYPGRFIVFANIDFNGFGGPGWTDKTVSQLEEDVRNGAKGLKIFKNLGLSVSDTDGKRVPVDDPRLGQVWTKCGELGIPVLIHSADPAPFWEPHDEYNERWLELKERPGRKRSATDPVPWQQIIDEQHRVFKKYSGTIFINAHLGWYGNDLQKFGRLVDEMPNMYSEIGAVLAELGRQPRSAADFLIKYQDRILFGKDAWVPDEYSTYFRVLETADEYFDYYRKRHAFWKMYGLALPDEVLRKIYYKNALKIIPGIDKSLFPD